MSKHINNCPVLLADKDRTQPATGEHWVRRSLPVDGGDDAQHAGGVSQPTLQLVRQGRHKEAHVLWTVGRRLRGYNSGL